MKVQDVALKKYYLPVLLLSLLIALLVAGFYVQKKWLPQQIRAVQTSLNVPVRYAFISDQIEPKIAVLDTYENTIINVLDTHVPAQLVAVSRLGGFLVYAHQDDSQIHWLDLESFQQKTVPIDVAVTALSISVDGQLIVAVAKDRVLFIDSQANIVKQLEFEGEVAATFSIDGQQLFIAEKNKGRILAYQLASFMAETLVELDGNVSAVSISIDSRALLFTASVNGKTAVYRYGLLDQQLTQSSVTVDFMRPYVSSDNHSVLLLAKNEGVNVVYQMQTETLVVLNRFILDQADLSTVSVLADNIRTGWLEQVGLVAEGRALYALDLTGESDDEKKILDKLSLNGQVASMMVQSDSKTLLATVQGEKSLLIYDVREHRLLQRIDLPLKQPGIVVMGQTNTLCH